MKLEPVLRLRDCDPMSGRWKVSALIGADTGTALPMLSAIIDGGPLPTANTDLGALSGVSFRRFDFDIAMTAVAQTVQYSVDGVTRQFTVPAKDTQPRFAYVSCNGFSSLKLMKSVEDKNALWKDIATRHGARAYHVLLMGGDQVYADSMWEMVDLLRVWNQLGWDDPQIVAALSARADDPSSLVREHVAWALAQQKARSPGCANAQPGTDRDQRIN